MDKLNTALDLYHLENHMNLLINTFLQQDFSFTHLWYFTDFIVNSNNISLTAVKFPVTVLATIAFSALNCLQCFELPSVL